RCLSLFCPDLPVVQRLLRAARSSSLSCLHIYPDRLPRYRGRGERECNNSTVSLLLSVMPSSSTLAGGKRPEKKVSRARFPAVSFTHLNLPSMIRSFPIWKRSLPMPRFHQSLSSTLERWHGQQPRSVCVGEPTLRFCPTRPSHCGLR